MSKSVLQSNQLQFTVFNFFHLRWIELVTTVSAYMERRARFNLTYSELAALTDRDLADIGIPRSQIAKLAREESMKVSL